MLRAALILAFINPSEPSCPAQPERVFLGAVSTNAPAFGLRVVEICGTFAGHSDRDPRERVMYDVSTYNGEEHAVFVFDPDRRLGQDRTRTCIVGTPRRRDGLSIEEARARGTSYVADVPLHLPDYVFYPLRCTCDGPALG